MKLVDGTTISMADTVENQKRYPQPRTQQPGLGFPVAWVVALLCLGSGAVLDSALGMQVGKEGSEHALFHTLLPHVAGRYYCSYAMIALPRARGADIVFQQHQRRRADFRKGRQLGTLDHVVVWNKPAQKPS